jgi:antirestriction protein ArdC
VPYLCEYRVFNAAQIDGLPSQGQRAPDWNPIEQAARVIQQLNPTIRTGGNRAYFSPGEDIIQMPGRGAFPDAGAWYGTLLHETAHWTDAPHRLNRQFGRFGDETYAREELRAEWASAMLSSELGISSSTDSHAAYLASWVKRLQKDKFEIFRAARDAEKICDFIMGRQVEEQVAPKETAAPSLTPTAKLEEVRRFQWVGERMLAEQGVRMPWRRSVTVAVSAGEDTQIHHHLANQP